ncbi:MAG: type II toxin-antitoxin system HicB family antitoxin [Pyrinomonadaceae bacterium]
MTREFNIIIEEDEDGFFVASVPEIHGCHTQAKSLDILMKRIREAIKLCLEVEEFWGKSINSKASIKLKWREI